MNHDCNMLIDYLPETVEIEGVEYEIESNFRTFILFEMLMQDSELSDSEKAMQGLKLAYPVIPDNLEAAVDELLWFYACGKRWREKRAGSVEGASEVQRIYSFEHDDDYIYSAFLTQYHIDLQDIKYLHWWKFKALLRTLSSDLEFCKIMEYRSVDINANMTKEQREKLGHYLKDNKRHRSQIPLLFWQWQLLRHFQLHRYSLVSGNRS